MDSTISIELLDELDGLNPTRAMILQAYYALRRAHRADQIGVSEIATWIRRYEPAEVQPSDSLVQLTLKRAKVPHRAPGRPRNDSRVSVPPPPFGLRRSLPRRGSERR